MDLRGRGALAERACTQKDEDSMNLEFFCPSSCGAIFVSGRLSLFTTNFGVMDLLAPPSPGPTLATVRDAFG